MPRSTAGRDWLAKIMADTASNASGAYAAANWIGLSTDATATDEARTTLPGEIEGGSLTRAQAAFAHTTGAASYTLSKTFTSDQQVTVAKYGVFNASTGGTMAFEVLLETPVSFSPGDSCQFVFINTL